MTKKEKDSTYKEEHWFKRPVLLQVMEQARKEEIKKRKKNIIGEYNNKKKTEPTRKRTGLND
jgi:hypothetical protein